MRAHPSLHRPIARSLARSLALAATMLLTAAACRRGAPAGSPAPSLEPVRAAVQAVLDSARAAGRWHGATLGLVLPDGRAIGVASGLADTAARTPMRPDHRMLQGSVGKTYVAAIALRLAAEGRLDLDAPIARYVGREPWFSGLVGGDRITVRHLMTHTSGLVRYEFNPVATKRLRDEPMRTWSVADRLSVLAGAAPPFAPGEGWEYSDTNYIVLGAIIEVVTGRRYDDLLRELLARLGLTETAPADRPRLTNLATGYAGAGNELGGYDASIQGGALLINPQFEWTGGGVYSTATDLARWGRLLYRGAALDSASRARMIESAVPSKLGPNVRYGLGVIVRPTRLGETWGHSGFFPGYATELVYVPSLGVSAALQVNGTAPYPRGMVGVLLNAIEEATRGQGPGAGVP